jgi:ABC-2 type transport system permease protein
VTLVIPLGILVFFSSVDAVNTSYKEPVDFLVPGVLALAVMSSAMVSLGIATGYERRYGVLKRLGSTPLSRAGLLASKTLNVLVLEVLQATLIVLTGVALGWDITGGLPTRRTGDGSRHGVAARHPRRAGRGTRTRADRAHDDP